MAQGTSDRSYVDPLRVNGTSTGRPWRVWIIAVILQTPLPPRERRNALNSARTRPTIKIHSRRPPLSAGAGANALEKAGAASAWQRRFPDGFHRILLDTPCSNTGVIRRRVDVRWRLQPDFLTEITGRQQHLLSVLLPLLKPGGRLVYSTCSIEPEENEQIIAAVLAKMPGFRELETRALVPHLSGTDGAWCSLIGRIS